MKQDKAEELEAYYAEAASWSADRQREAARSQRLAWIAAGAATLVALAEAVALIAITPLKTVVPYTLLVDRQTGFVQALDPINGEKLTPDAALTRSFLVQYVIARESFAIDALQPNYRKAVLWSDGDVQSNYIAQMQASNPLSPLAAYPRRTVIEVQVKSVSVIDADTAMVRYATIRRDPGAQPREDGSWVSVISFRYDGEPMTVEDRLINPLGFKVTRYSRDMEAAPGPVVSVAEPVTQPVIVQPAPTESERPRVIRRVPPGVVAP